MENEIKRISKKKKSQNMVYNWGIRNLNIISTYHYLYRTLEGTDHQIPHHTVLKNRTYF